MINWQDHKGGFVGGAKTAIKGVFKYVYAAFTQPIIDTQDCFLSVTSVISDDPLSVVSTIGDGLSLGSAVNDDILSVVSTIKENLSTVSAINDNPLSTVSAIKDNLSVTSVICNC